MKEYIKGFDEAKLKEAVAIKKAYSNGEISMELANAQMKAHIGSIKPSELAYIEQYMQQMVDDECIKENLEEVMGIYKDVLIEETSDLPAGHPIQNYIDENAKMRELIVKMEAQFQKNYIKNVWDELVEDLNQFKIHLSRKQNQLYSLLEQKGFDRPTTTMWLFDNAVRDRISALSEKLGREFQYDEIKEEFEEFKAYLLDLMDKEESILYPTSLEMIKEAEFYEMIFGDKEIGYCLISPSEEFSKKYSEMIKANHKSDEFSQNAKYGTTSAASSEQSSQNQGFADELSALLSKYNVGGWNEDTPMNVKQGILSLNQINLLFQHLPVDISYVDEKELVAFYSDTKHRVFPRSKGVIGRDVKNCHPKNSVHVVEEIIEKFRSGEQDRVEFWINKPNVFIYILYVAIRDENGNFKGVMEMMQDCTKIRALEGSRTLLNWENDSSSTSKKEEQSESQSDGFKNREEAQEEFSEEQKLMKLEPKTKISKLFKDYPGFKEYLIQKSDSFKLLNSPMFKVMEPIATIEMASERSKMSVEELQMLLDEYREHLK